MKGSSLLPGLLIGLVGGFLLTKGIQSRSPSGVGNVIRDTTTWKWADSLDAVKAAPDNHQVVFENDKIRILEVILKPYEYEQMHTHRLPSVMFGANNDTASFNIIYYRYKYDSLNHDYAIRDSVVQHNGGNKLNEPNTGYFMKPEGPHRIKNLSNVRLDMFRVEFKQ